MKHVLIVDDDTSVANLVARILRDYRVTIAHNGAEALALASQLPPCTLLITDYLMPTMTGDELAGRLRARQPEVKTLLVTGHGAYIDVDDAVVDAELPKPFGKDELRRVVATLIGASS